MSVIEWAVCADAFVVAVTRITGIVYGVVLTMVMSVIVFPKSASHQVSPPHRFIELKPAMLPTPTANNTQ